MAIAIALSGLNDLRRFAKPTFLSRNRFIYKLNSPLCQNNAQKINVGSKNSSKGDPLVVKGLKNYLP